MIFIFRDLAASRHLQAIDLVTLDFRNMDILTRQAEGGRALGYTGKVGCDRNTLFDT